ncbi:hypothetical protein ACIRPK_03730 [Kitasatospora sp. NPDC101801]|uniref:hypothetical protein n=1 Tax=Kitasatospora sp. NPDC101801 TaxID=3364103 RepID=UPI003820ACD9
MLEVGHFMCTLVMWSGGKSRWITRWDDEVEPYGYGDRELFGHPAEDAGELT